MHFHTNVRVQSDSPRRAPLSTGTFYTRDLANTHLLGLVGGIVGVRTPWLVTDADLAPVGWFFSTVTLYHRHSGVEVSMSAWACSCPQDTGFALDVQAVSDYIGA